MANQEHLDILKQGVETWNLWRKEHADIQPDLREVFLRRANLIGADLSDTFLSNAILSNAILSNAILSNAILRGADLSEANLIDTDLRGADLRGADLRGADLIDTIFIEANLIGAILSNADLRGANLSSANLSSANLIGADLSRTILVETNFEEATLTNCNIYGIAAWNVKLKGTKQHNLVITSSKEPTLAVDNLEVAQFIYLLLNNPKIRDVIDTIAKTAVLILGRFTPERKAILDALREALRARGYLPILFDFDKPASRDITETVSTLAHLARFVIADITDAKSIPQELMAIVPNLPSVPVQPLILNVQHEYGMFEHFTRFLSVLPVYQYIDQASLLQSLIENVIDPAEQKAQELAKR